MSKIVIVKFVKPFASLVLVMCVSISVSVDTYAFSNITTCDPLKLIKSRRMRLAGHVARMGRRGTRIDYWWEDQRKTKA
jgi:hypothetical protein